MEDLPKMNDTFDLYLNEKVDKLEITEQSRVHNVRTTDYTISNFAASKHTRLWSMKMNGQYIDSLICTTNNYQEAVHMDLILALNPKTGNFFQLVPQDSTSSTSVQKFIVDSFITSALLKEIIYYAYNRKCTLTEQNSVSIADFAAKYGIDSLVQYCLDYLMNHVSVNNVIKGFELADMDRFVNVTARTFFQSFIEDHLEQLFEMQHDFESIIQTFA
ncbi:hypothetical protein RDWZM_002521 [Blomia tropicalis]|uniref:BTB domain-containing protein n=1 Tax=Blomia tropicalis TaxID=40697 RepID=A0A9Q0RSA0_BLOTA|nr:hypothetical protein RDWZM_002521 [Blomia tropicalis]